MSDILKYIIVDDDEIDRCAVETEAARFPFLQLLFSCSHPLEGAELIKRFNPDVVFVDIEMPDISGLELVSLCRNSHMQPVFITSHPEFAVESYNLEAFDYLVKPFSSERFARCVLRLRDFISLKGKAYSFDEEKESGFIIVKQGYEKHRLQLKDIQYLEAMKDYTRIKTSEKTFLVLSTLSGMLEQLPADQFLRIHRSFVVNVDKVTEVAGNSVYVQSVELPLGKLHKHVLNGKF